MFEVRVFFRNSMAIHPARAKISGPFDTKDIANAAAMVLLARSDVSSVEIIEYPIYEEGNYLPALLWNPADRRWDKGIYDGKTIWQDVPFSKEQAVCGEAGCKTSQINPDARTITEELGVPPIEIKNGVVHRSM